MLMFFFKNRDFFMFQSKIAIFITMFPEKKHKLSFIFYPYTRLTLTSKVE